MNFVKTVTGVYVTKQHKIGYRQLAAGYRFPIVSYRLDTGLVNTYLKAVGETSSLYCDHKLVPPMAIATYAMASLSKGFAVPPGTIHVSQEIEFIDTVSIGDTITCQAIVSRKQDRGRIHLLTSELNVFNQSQKKVLAGRTCFVLPEQGSGNRL